MPLPHAVRPPFRAGRRAAGILLVWGAVFGAAPVPSPVPGAPVPEASGEETGDAVYERRSQGTWRLFRGLVGAGRVALAVAEGDLVPLARRAARRLEREGEVVPRVTVDGRDADPAIPRIVVARWGDRVVSSLAVQAGVTVERGGFEVLGRRFDVAHDVLRATFEDPRRPGLPVTLVVGPDAETLLPHLSRLRARWRPELRVWERGELALALELTANGVARRDTLVDYRARWGEVGAQPLPFGGVVF